MNIPSGYLLRFDYFAPIGGDALWRGARRFDNKPAPVSVELERKQINSIFALRPEVGKGTAKPLAAQYWHNGRFQLSLHCIAVASSACSHVSTPF